MTEDTVWDDETDWSDNLNIEIVGGDSSYEPREPRDGEKIKDYSLAIANKAGIRKIGVKFTEPGQSKDDVPMLKQNDDLAQEEVKDLEGTLFIGQHDTLA